MPLPKPSRVHRPARQASSRPRLSPVALAIHLSVCGAAFVSVTGQAHAQATAAAIQYDVPAGPLAEALNRFALQSGVAIVVDANKVQGLRSQGLKGTYGVEEGFGILLRGSEYVIAKTTAGYVLVSAPVAALAASSDSTPSEPTLPVVRVTASSEPLPGELPKSYAGGQVASGTKLGILGNRSVFDAPFSATGYTAQTIQDQQARTFADVMDNDPSIRLGGSRYATLEGISIRGFGLPSSDFSFDGFVGLGDRNKTPIEGLERVEIIKGPNALLNGVPPTGGIGGAINLVPKRAMNTPTTSLKTGYISDGQIDTHIDFGRRFGTDKAWGIRLNGAYRDGNTPIDRQQEKLAVGTLGLDYRGEKVRFSFDYLRFNNDLQPELRRILLAPNSPIPSAPSGKTNLNQSWERVDSRSNIYSTRAEIDLAPNWTLGFGYGVGSQEFESLTADATVLNAAGAATRSAPFFGSQSGDKRIGDINLTGSLETGGVLHKVSAGLTNAYSQIGFEGRSFGGPSPTNLYLPTLVPEPLRNFSVGTPKISDATQSSFVLADTVSALDDRLMVTFGVRNQRIKSNNFDGASGINTSAYDKSANTPSLAFLIKPIENVSIYGNYIEGLQAGPTAPITATNAGQVFSPTKAKQYEAGVKIDLGNLGFTAALFEITQASAITDPNTGRFDVDGRQVNRGIELFSFGEIRRGLRILGGVTFTDAKLAQTAGGLNNGKTAPGVPDWQLNVGTEWDVESSPGLSFNGRIIHTGTQFFDTNNVRTLPAWTRFDIGARYKTKVNGRPTTFRASIENIFDEHYFSAVSRGLELGAPRTVVLSATVEF